MHGVFHFKFQDGQQLSMPNRVVDAGAEAFIRAIVLNETMGLAGTPPLFYLGLCNKDTVEPADILSSITLEPAVLNGYSRKSIERNSVGWPTISLVNGQLRALSKVITFTATGGDFSATFSRAFICSVASGSVGTLFAVSSALPAPIALASMASFQLQYELFFR